MKKGVFTKGFLQDVSFSSMIITTFMKKFINVSTIFRDSSAVEQRAVNALVVGSIPTRGALIQKATSSILRLFVLTFHRSTTTAD